MSGGGARPPWRRRKVLYSAPRPSDATPHDAGLPSASVHATQPLHAHIYHMDMGMDMDMDMDTLGMQLHDAYTAFRMTNWMHSHTLPWRALR